MIITYDYGHGCGADRGASGYLNEEKVIREYGPIVVSKLKELGHTLYDCTPPADSNLTLGQSLAYRVNKANSIGSQLHLCMHVNAYEIDVATGCEVEYASDSGKVYADRVSADISSTLGLTNRGAKLQNSLYVLRYTNMVAILIEPFFCDTKADCDKYNAEKLATAIVKGITGIDTSTQNNEAAQPIVQTASTYEETVPTGQNIWQIPGMPFYIELRADGDMAIHLDRGNYIVIRKGGAPEVYYNNNKGQGGSKRLF
ncbi:N-acetylmuramoyl-L-alanine amidase [Clostridium sp.]|uniref:N-acetylmuramoyl-L-alanine amidase n=1 Tax=Clostridium sp. TaxID=1506 RepID=UPI0035A15039